MNEVTYDLNHRLLELELVVSSLKQQVSELEQAVCDADDEVNHEV